MKFGKKNKKEESPCESCGAGTQALSGMSQAEALKKLKEMEGKRVKPEDCPFISDCDFRMLPEIGNMICLDQEVGGRQGQGYMIHMQGHHFWEQCRKYAETLREEKGVLPRDLKKTLKETKEK